MKIVFCVPGLNFSAHWIKCWTETIDLLLTKKIECQYSIDYAPNIYAIRNVLLGGNPKKGTNQKPFNGLIKYDYIFWIDDDILWNPRDVITLIETDKDIVSGCYMLADLRSTAICKDYDIKTYSDLSKSFDERLVKGVDLIKMKEPFKAAYTGLGFTAVKYGVFESMTFPWFMPEPVTDEDFPEFLDFTGEDISFCMKAKRHGYDTWVNPNVRVKHLKKVPLLNL